MNDHDLKQLVGKAIEARERAYAPYSRFRVGAALLAMDGQIYPGCNVENAAYGSTNCAERTALFAAIADGCKPRAFSALAVVGDTPRPIAPCGVCRQVMVELCSPDMPVIMADLAGKTMVKTVAELLPDAFSLSERQKPVEP